MGFEPRPKERYYQYRTPLFSQGDIFRDVPLAYPAPWRDVGFVEELDEVRAFLSGPLEFGPAMLVTPTCSMRSQSATGDYAHPVRTLVPLRPVDELIDLGILDNAKVGLAKSKDSLINYMWLPADDEIGLPDSLALLYMPVTVHPDLIDSNRIAQLTREAAQQLQLKLVWHASSVLLERREFDPAMD